jgi:prepilin-type N-terminal cleavage/methylation domain-containing protein
MQKKKGFTLIELLVVVAIIGLLATLSIVALNTARAKARDAKRVGDVKQIQTALELYYNDQGAYPVSATSGTAISSGTTVYMSVVPTAPTPFDPGTTTCTALTNSYKYTQDGTGVSYSLTYCLGAATGNIKAGINTATPAGVATK